MDGGTVTLAVVAGVLAAPMVAVSIWFTVAWIRGPAIPLPAESIVARDRAFFVTVPGNFGKNGSLVLTTDHLLWIPIPFPFPRGDQLAIPLRDITNCELRKMTLAPFGYPLSIMTAEREYIFYIGVEVPVGWSKGSLWQSLLAERASAPKA